MLFFKMQNYIKYLNYKKIIYFIPELVDISFPNLWTFYSRTCGHFIPELVDISFPNLWTFHSRKYGLFIPDFVSRSLRE